MKMIVYYKVMEENKMKKCPHCGSTESYYLKYQVYGSAKCYFNFDGSEAENGDMYEYLQHKGGKVAYCSNCHKKICKAEELK